MEKHEDVLRTISLNQEKEGEEEILVKTEIHGVEADVKPFSGGNYTNLNRQQVLDFIEEIKKGPASLILKETAENTGEVINIMKMESTDTHADRSWGDIVFKDGSLEAFQVDDDRKFAHNYTECSNEANPAHDGAYCVWWGYQEVGNKIQPWISIEKIKTEKTNGEKSIKRISIDFIEKK